MRFYNRENELKIMSRIQEASHSSARFTVLTGRRRIGKTELIKHVFSGENYLYFFMARRSEGELCENFTKEIEEKLGIPMPGTFHRISDIIKYVLRLACQRPITLVLDEFQELLRINPGTYSALQGDWDMLKGESKINLVVSGSAYRTMNAIFRDEHEPLYGRQTDFLKLNPFSTEVLRDILLDHKADATNEDLLALYSFTGGVAKYVELLMDNGAYDRDSMLDVIFREESTFLQEGKVCLSDEFGKEYGNYYSLLSAIARGRTSRAEISNEMGGIEIGGFLKNLMDDYGLIMKKQPMFDKPLSKNVRYAMNDNFFIFWFRFIARYSYMLEIGALERLKEVVKRDYDTFSGMMLERYFRQKYAEMKTFTRIGGWWDRKGENEIDLIAEDELEKKAVIAEVKRDKTRISLGLLRQKAEKFLEKNDAFKYNDISFKALSIQDM